MAPEWGLFPGPNSQQAVIGGDGVQAVPQERPQMVGQREVAEGLAVDPALALGDLQADRAQHLEGRHHFARRIDGDVDASARQRADALGDALGRQARPGQPLRPGRDHAPFERLRARDGRRRQQAGGGGAQGEIASRGHSSLHCA